MKFQAVVLCKKSVSYALLVLRDQLSEILECRGAVQSWLVRAGRNVSVSEREAARGVDPIVARTGTSERLP
jgi:hypothetical protein